MSYIGKTRRREKKPVPQPNERPIPVPDWPKPQKDPAEQPIEAPGWPQVVPATFPNK